MITIKQAPDFAKWYSKLKDRQAKARIDVRLRRISLGNMGDTKPVGDGVQEIRIFYGPGYRVYFAQAGKTVVLLLCGGDKSTQSADIAKAKRIKEEFGL
ncbi:putative addiction module killer protein [Roseibium sp. TrichSKD4]|uniref:type II toxin-antitoxin system RelE/ParE family toxin n=1 Tax=Roseibium sp. TrichSKD4 TaxID=744980 RepID=UPI0001E56FD1|nr:type II toxin-antitoxin system RelE/ParE family toxin [Roseibium sp. TrichSKD4]EFO31354.1 putative addiction module killer protein [Roseibium sp. TrichSKD4]